jgi:hypothetical protein
MPQKRFSKYSSFFISPPDSSTPSTTTTEDVTDIEPPAKKPNKKGRIVTWAEDHKLASFHYFEMDEDERGKDYKMLLFWQLVLLMITRINMMMLMIIYKIRMMV